MRFFRTNKSVFNIGYHLIWCLKYRRKVLVKEIERRFKKALKREIKTNIYYHYFIKKAWYQLQKLIKAFLWKKRDKAKDALARIYRCLDNYRRNYFFSLAHELTDTYDYIFLEDLNIKAMQMLFGKKVFDLSFNAFVKILEHIRRKKGKVVHKINRFFPSIKICSSCNLENQEIKFKIRSWLYPNCHEEHDRDINAATNILREGASSLSLDIVSLENSSEYCLKLESNVP